MTELKPKDPNQMTGAAMIVRALADHGVKHLFGYPGGAVLPIPPARRASARPKRSRAPRRYS